MGKSAIYHFTNESKKRPIIYRKQLKALKDYAISIGFEDIDIYCDMSLKRCERTEFERFLANCSRYDALITKDFYHISKNTGTCIKIMQELHDKGVQVYSIENGMYEWSDVDFNKHKCVATYDCHFGTHTEMKEIISVRNDIFTLFTNKKTNWTVIDQYYDESLCQKDSEQIKMKELIANRDKYDLLLVHCLNDIHWRTANFCKIRHALKLDIYSFKEGFLKYNELCKRY